MSLVIESRETGKIKYFILNGVLDQSTAEYFETGLEKIDGYEAVYIDFNKLRFIDSTGIHALAQVIKKCNEKNIVLKINNMSTAIYEILDVLGLVQVFGDDIFE